MGNASAFRHAATIAAIIAVWPAPAIAKQSKQELAAIARSPEQAAYFVNVKNDKLDTVIQLDTEPFFQARQGLLGSVNSDQFLRAFIDKSSGKTTFQIYKWVRYVGPWSFFNAANYETADGPKSAQFTEIHSEVESCLSYGCIKREDFGFQVPEQVLRDVAKDAKAGDDSWWSFKVYARNGSDLTGEMLKTEIAGLLIRVDQERAEPKK